MKKLFLLATLAVALIFAGCANNSSKDSDKDGEKSVKGISSLPEDLREVMEEADEEFKNQFAESDEIIYKGISVDGKDIIITLQLTEEALDGESLKSAAKKEGMTSETLKASFVYGLQSTGGQEDLAEMLKEQKYNIVIRMIGQDKDDKIEAKITYKDLAKNDYYGGYDAYDYDDEDDEYYSYEPEAEVEAVSAATTLDRTEAAVRAIEAARSMEEAYGIVLEYEDLDDEDFTPAQQERLERAFERLQ